MRIPDTSSTLLNALNVANQAEQTALTQLTTGRRVNVASDDPSAAASQVGLAAQSDSCDQFLRSISSVSSELQTADSALSSGVTALQHAISLGVEGANGTMSQQDLAALANQVQSISQQMLGIANLSYNGKYIFAGTADSQPPYVSAAGGIAYQGNDGVNQVEVEAGQTIAVNQPGSQLFSAAGASVFQALSDLATALRSSSSTSTDIGNATNEVRAAYDQMNSARGFYGATLNQLTSTQDFLNSEKLQLTQQTSNTVGVDPNQAATNLSNAEVARNAVLQAAASIGNLSLFNYLTTPQS
ncbi:MAG: flagellar hook-associated protein FlgL [Candidatus Korobacteraceae bacterium]